MEPAFSYITEEFSRSFVGFLSSNVDLRPSLGFRAPTEPILLLFCPLAPLQMSAYTGWRIGFLLQSINAEPGRPPNSNGGRERLCMNNISGLWRAYCRRIRTSARRDTALDDTRCGDTPRPLRRLQWCGVDSLPKMRVRLGDGPGYVSNTSLNFVRLLCWLLYSQMRSRLLGHLVLLHGVLLRGTGATVHS